MKEKNSSSASYSKRHTTSTELLRPAVEMHNWVPKHQQTTVLWPSNLMNDYYPANYWVRHSDFERLDIQIVLKGNLLISADGESFLAESGMTVVVPPGAHKLQTGPARYCVKRGLCIQGMLLKVVLQNFGLEKLMILPNFGTPEIFEIFNRILLLLDRKELEDIPELASLAYRVLICIAMRNTPQNLPPALIRCSQFIEQNNFKKTSIAELCRIAGCSKSTLLHLFRVHFKATPIEYIIKLRLEHARNLLENLDLPIKEVALLCGQKNQLYFSYDFRKHLGCSPKAYRENLVKTKERAALKSSRRTD